MRKKKGPAPVLTDVSFSLQKGTVTAITGPNGSGKSTLLKALCGFLPVWQGEIALFDDSGNCKPITAFTAKERARKIAYVSQQHQIPDIEVGRLVLQGRFPYTTIFSAYTESDYNAARAAMEKMGMYHLAGRKMRELSGGQQQKAYLAMALAQQSDVLILDEPLTFLDIRQQLELMETLKALASEGKTICLVIHDLNTALTQTDSVLLLNEGRIVSQGPGKKLAEHGCIEQVFGVTLHARSLGESGGQSYTFSLETQ